MLLYEIGPARLNIILILFALRCDLLKSGEKRAEKILKSFGSYAAPYNVISIAY